jgi:hypothetical protein
MGEYSVEEWEIRSNATKGRGETKETEEENENVNQKKKGR